MSDCIHYRELSARAMDDVLPGHESLALQAHLDGCVYCRNEAVALQRTQYLASSLGRVPAPRDLALRLRIAISHERTRRFNHRWHAFTSQLQDAFRAMMVPATGGFITAVLVFGLVIGLIGNTYSVNASGPDVPTLLYSAPKLSSNAMAGNMQSLNVIAPVTIEAYVDSNGRIGDYRIVAGEDSTEVRLQLNRALMFTIFEPARSFGTPTSGRVMMTFANVNVSVKG